MRVAWRAAAIGILLCQAVAAQPASAQTSRRLAHGDVSVGVGWLQVNQERLNERAGWSRDHVFRSLELGWYWTEQLKTTIETGPETESYAYARNPVVIEGRQFENYSFFESSRRRLALMQQYQFGHNQWIHPFVAGGIELVRERSEQTEPAIYAYDASRPPRLLREAIEHPERSETFTQGLAAAGVKAYVHRRVFFTTDLRVGFSQRLEEVLLRVGFGVDF